MATATFTVSTSPDPPFAETTFGVVATVPASSATTTFSVTASLPPRYLQMCVGGGVLVPVQLGRFNGTTIDWLSPGL